MLQLTSLIGFIILAASSAWAQTPTPGSPPATGPAETGQTGGITDYWWIVLLVVLVVAAIWYFSSRRNRV